MSSLVSHVSRFWASCDTCDYATGRRRGNARFRETPSQAGVRVTSYALLLNRVGFQLLIMSAPPRQRRRAEKLQDRSSDWAPKRVLGLQNAEKPKQPPTQIPVASPARRMFAARCPAQVPWRAWDDGHLRASRYQLLNELSDEGEDFCGHFVSVDLGAIVHGATRKSAW